MIKDDEPSSSNVLENSVLTGNLENYRDDIELESRNFVIENIDNESN